MTSSPSKSSVSPTRIPPAGRSSIALNEIEDAARELGVTLLRCTDTFDIQDTDLASERLLACHKKLVEQGAEAVYLTYNVGLQASAMRNVLQPLADAHIPTFSQLGVPDVVHGALLSVAQSNAAEEGRFSAGLVEAILKGARPRDLSPVFESPVSMALNLFHGHAHRLEPAAGSAGGRGRILPGDEGPAEPPPGRTIHERRAGTRYAFRVCRAPRSRAGFSLRLSSSVSRVAISSACCPQRAHTGHLRDISTFFALISRSGTMRLHTAASSACIKPGACTGGWI